jgi:predicted outer membrane repeat protein
MTTFDTLTAKFLSNSSSYAEDGGAILNGESTVSFVNSTVSFSNNSARYGGAILNLRSSVSFVNSTVSFLANTAREGGGAILNWNYSTVSFVNSTASFSSNTAREDGGAILNWNYSAVSFVNSRVNFLGNSSKAEGGAILNSDYSAVSFVNSTVSFVSNSVRDFGGAIENRLSILVFDKSTAIFFKNTAKTGGAIYNQGSTVSFVNSTASFLSNTATGNGGAIFNDSKSTIIFKGRSSMIFENNTASKGADIYNNGTIEISERSEVILRSGIDWDPTKDGVINIKSGTLTISADKIFISVLNVSAGGKFSLVDRQAIFATVYKTKTARIDKLTVAGILEIGIDLSTDNLNDIISSADSITFQKGSSLKIAPFNEWSSPKTYSVIFEGDLRGFENLNYDRSRFVLNYDNKTKTLSLRVISDPTQ